MDLDETVLVFVVKLTSFCSTNKKKHFWPVFRIFCWPSKLGRSLIFLPLFLAAYSSMASLSEAGSKRGQSSLRAAIASAMNDSTDVEASTWI